MQIQYDPSELVPVDLDKRRHLLYPVAALRVICRATGEASPQKAIASLLQSEDQLGAVSVLIHAGLLHEDRTLTVEDVEWMLTPERLKEANRALRAALFRSDESKEGGGADADPPKASETSA